MSAETLFAVAAVLSLPGVVQVGGEKLAAASCATRETLWIEHYDAALYVRPGTDPAAALQDAGRAKAVEIRLRNRLFMPAELPRKYRVALEPHLGEETMRRVRAAYRSLRIGDVITVAYQPATGLTVGVNGERVAGAAGHRAVDAILSVWADRVPVDRKLREVLARNPCPPLTG